MVADLQTLRARENFLRGKTSMVIESENFARSPRLVLKMLQASEIQYFKFGKMLSIL